MAVSVGIVGLGKLGLPVAVSLALRGHEVMAYDIDPTRMALSALSPLECGPEGRGSLAACLDGGLPLRFASLKVAAREPDCVFVIVQTPHAPGYEGITPLPDSRSDFGYTALTKAVRDVAGYARRGAEIGVMSTVLPGTTRSLILPQVQDHTLVYCPQFVGMGTVARDLRNPEFTLIGRGSREPAIIPEVLSGLGDAPVFTVSYETAELAKMIYNTFVSAKVTLANIVQRMASETSAQASDVFRIIRAADQRLGSAAYIGPGMGDGGPCHPRDNVALSWLARRAGMGADLFSAVMESRQAYIEWLSDRFVELAAGLPLVLLGTAFKPGTDIEAGSSAVLLANLLGLRGVDVQIVRTPDDLHPHDRAAAFFIGCPEPPFLTFPFPPGSVVVDPWHRVGRPDGVTVHHIGEAPAARGPAAQAAQRHIPAQR